MPSALGSSVGSSHFGDRQERPRTQRLGVDETVDRPSTPSWLEG